jgi:NACHT domain/TIR domain
MKGTEKKVQRMRVELFLCYVREDETLCQNLEKHLRPLQQQGLIEIWSDRQVAAGTEWQCERDQHLHSAHLILVLVSPDFLASDTCYGGEMQQAMERHERGEAQVIPILLRHVYWQDTPFGKLAALPQSGKPIRDRTWHSIDEAFFQVAQGLRMRVEELLSGQPASQLLPLEMPDLVSQPEHSSFFGRLVQRCTFRKKYAEDLRALCQKMELTGSKIGIRVPFLLEHLFVELRMVSTPAHQTSPDPFLTKKSSSGELYSIWHYLGSKKLAGQHFVIVGAPGSGKTTLLKHIVLRLLAPKKDVFFRSRRLPLLLSLRDHQEEITRREGFSLLDALNTQLRRKGKPFLRQWFEQQLERGACLILLDGLDEVADPQRRRQVSKWVQGQMERYHRNRFILTSRPYGYQEENWLAAVTLEIQPFGSEQIAHYLHRWYLAEETGHARSQIPEEARQKAENLLGRLRLTPALLEISVNPLLLTMLVHVHQYQGALPTTRCDLYAQICRVFLEKRSEARGLTVAFSSGQVQGILQHLAYEMMSQQRRELSLDEIRQVLTPPLRLIHPSMPVETFLQLVEDASSFVLEHDDGFYRFAHLTFQEYLAAVDIKEEGREDVLVERVGQSWWRETIRFYCAQADATAIVQACLAGSTREALIQAFECAEEGLKLEPEVQARLDCMSEEPDLKLRQMAAEALLARRLHRMLPLHQKTYMDTSLITCAEYQLFLDEKRAQGHSHQPDHWETVSFPKGSGKAPILGVRRSDAEAFCAWLTERDPQGWRYRLPFTEELPVQEPEQWKILESEAGYWTSGSHTPPRKYSSWEDLLDPSFKLMVIETRFKWVRQRSPKEFLQHLDSIRDHARDAVNASDFVKYLKCDLDKALSRACVCDLDALFTYAHKLDGDLTHLKALVDAESFWSRLFSDTRDRAQELALWSIPINAIASLLALDRQHASLSSEAVAEACTIAGKLIEDLTRYRQKAEDREFNAEFMSAPADATVIPGRSLPLKRLDESVEAAFDLSLWVHLLQRRLNGTLPPYEGILLVKER